MRARTSYSAFLIVAVLFGCSAAKEEVANDIPAMVEESKPTVETRDANSKDTTAPEETSDDASVFSGVMLATPRILLCSATNTWLSDDSLLSDDSYYFAPDGSGYIDESGTHYSFSWKQTGTAVRIDHHSGQFYSTTMTIVEEGDDYILVEDWSDDWTTNNAREQLLGYADDVASMEGMSFKRSTKYSAKPGIYNLFLKK